MAHDFWDMTYSDALRYELTQIQSTLQRIYFLAVFDRMGKYVVENEEDELTFREYFNMFER